MEKFLITVVLIMLIQQVMMEREGKIVQIPRKIFRCA